MVDWAYMTGKVEVLLAFVVAAVVPNSEVQTNGQDKVKETLISYSFHNLSFYQPKALAALIIS
jgi:hypothetical protein